MSKSTAGLRGWLNSVSGSALQFSPSAVALLSAVYSYSFLHTHMTFRLAAASWKLRTFFNKREEQSTSPYSRVPLGRCLICSGIRLEIQCTINVMCLNHSETIPSPHPRKNCLPRNPYLVPKRVGTTEDDSLLEGASADAISGDIPSNATLTAEKMSPWPT